MSAQDGKLRVRVPGCGCELVIDAQTGAVLSQEKPAQPPGGGKDFDALLAGVDDAKQRAGELFEREIAAFKDRDRLLDAKFEEAVRRAQEQDDDEEPPVRPWDLD